MKGFNSLELFFKKDFVKSNARFLLSIQFFQHTVELYYWDKFFIEQYFDNQQKKITFVKLANTSDLEKYIMEINISDLGLLTRL
jgi:hypothetical protein